MSASDVRMLITGGAGFIGRSCVAECLRLGHEVTVLDNFIAGRRANVEEFAGRIELIEGDILDSNGLDSIMKRRGITHVLHLAAHHFIPFCDAHPLETMRVNVEGTYSVFNAAAKAQVRTIVVASSGVVYPSQECLLNEDGPTLVSDVYGLSKLVCEQIAQMFAETTSLACRVGRLFNTYGPYETNPHLIPHIIDELKLGDTVRLGNVHTKRDYIYVEDTARLLVRCAMCESRETKFFVTNIGTGQEYSARELVGLIGELLGCPLDLRTDTDRVRASDKLHQRADTRRLEELLGELPAHDIRAGMHKLLKFSALA